MSKFRVILVNILTFFNIWMELDSSLLYPDDTILFKALDYDNILTLNIWFKKISENICFESLKLKNYCTSTHLSLKMGIVMFLNHFWKENSKDNQPQDVVMMIIFVETTSLIEIFLDAIIGFIILGLFWIANRTT